LLLSSGPCLQWDLCEVDCEGREFDFDLISHCFAACLQLYFFESIFKTNRCWISFGANSERCSLWGSATLKYFRWEGGPFLCFSCAIVSI
jgi:hypothetical protein